MKPDCIPWAGSFDSKGYGRAWLNGKHEKAHRAVWIQRKGVIPAGMVVRHTCDNRCCVNLEHLMLGTQLENIEDRQARGRQAWGERHGRAKLSDDDVVAIREMDGTHVEIARKFGVAATTILRIRAGQSRVRGG